MLLTAMRHVSDRYTAWDYWFHAGKRKVSNAEIRKTKFPEPREQNAETT
jgi:hypothetical protein